MLPGKMPNDLYKQAEKTAVEKERLMEEMTLHIKNMVCPRCVMAVEEVLTDLQIAYERVQLGEVVLGKALSKEQRKHLEQRLQSLGFELLESARSTTISKIKTLIIEQIHYSKEPMTMNFSDLIADKLHHDYGYLSRLFSSVEGMTIEKFITRQKIERVKELLFYNEMTLSEIAWQMGYSSVAYLSTQFKKETGMTPSQFRKDREPRLNSLDKL